jgi:putative RecB family exonuclease
MMLIGEITMSIIKDKRWLSKSQINTYIQCPYKWKLQYIDGKKSKPSSAMIRGINIHSNIEKFYSYTTIKNNQIIPSKSLGDVGNFLKFEQRRIKNCFDKNGNVDLKYYKPVNQELKVSNEDIKLRGFIDAIYINPEDNKAIIIDWKTGKYRPNNFSDYRFELSVYTELYRLQTGITPGYWGIYFVDADKLFFEKVKSISIKAMYNKVEKVRDGIESKDYKCNPGILCRWCSFNGECVAWK